MPKKYRRREGDRVLYAPNQTQRYKSQWTRYQKGLALAESNNILQIDDDIYRVPSERSPIGYWEVTQKSEFTYQLSFDSTISGDTEELNIDPISSSVIFEENQTQLIWNPAMQAAGGVGIIYEGTLVSTINAFIETNRTTVLLKIVPSFRASAGELSTVQGGTFQIAIGDLTPTVVTFGSEVNIIIPYYPLGEEGVEIEAVIDSPNRVALFTITLSVTFNPSFIAGSEAPVVVSQTVDFIPVNDNGEIVIPGDGSSNNGGDYECTCPDFSKFEDAFVPPPFESMAFPRDWGTSVAGAPAWADGKRRCYHIVGVQQVRDEDIPVPTDFPLGEA